MASDHQFDSTVERIASMVRGELQGALERHATQLAESARVEREAAVQQAADAARRDAHDQLEQVRRAAHEHVESARRAAQSEAAARARAEAQVEDVRRIGRTQVEDVQRTMTERLSAMMRELDEARRELVARRQELDAARGESAAALHELVRGLHAIDEADSLSAGLQRLIESARAHSSGAVVFLARGEDLREWHHDGPHDDGDVVEAVAAVASSAVRERRRVESPSAIAFPISVGGDVVAVLHAEVEDALSPQRRVAKDALDALTRHAGRVLEAITIEQATGLRAGRRDSSAGPHRSGERL